MNFNFYRLHLNWKKLFSFNISFETVLENGIRITIPLLKTNEDTTGYSANNVVWKNFVKQK